LDYRTLIADFDNF